MVFGGQFDVFVFILFSILPLLQESERVVFQFDGVTGKASLKISDVTIHDLGEYRCSFNNPLGTAETKGNLVVKSELPYLT